MAQYGADLAKGIPFVGGIIGMLDSIIETLYNTYQENRLENKINAINRVIMNKFKNEEEISIGIAKLAIAMAEAKEKDIVYPEISTPVLSLFNYQSLNNIS